MSTIADALQNAADSQQQATAAMLAIRDQIATTLAQAQTTTTTTINNFLNRAPYANLYIDANNGVDGLGRGSITTPFKTIDFALDNRDTSVYTNIWLLTDVVMSKTHVLLQKVAIIGMTPIAANANQPYTYALRKLTFAPEASDSPRYVVGRCPAFFDMQNAGILFVSIQLYMPTLPSGVNWPYLVSGNGNSVDFQNCQINVDTAGSTVVLINATSGRLTCNFNNTVIGSNVAGKLFGSVAAGANPNNVFGYCTNLTSA